MQIFLKKCQKNGQKFKKSEKNREKWQKNAMSLLAMDFFFRVLKTLKTSDPHNVKSCTMTYRRLHTVGICENVSTSKNNLSTLNFIQLTLSIHFDHFS